MIGYDRPLKPEWIYKSLQMVEPGKKPEDFYDAYNDIAVELTGKDGRRKTRTVLFGCGFKCPDVKILVEKDNQKKVLAIERFTKRDSLQIKME